MEIWDFDFSLPDTLIALEPAAKRDASRLLVLGKNGAIGHRRFADLPDYLEKGDLLILNDTKVLPVRLSGRKPSGGRLEVLLVKNISGNRWEVLSKGRYTGRLNVSDTLSLVVKDGKTAELLFEGDLRENLFAHGDMPLPPYIRRRPSGLDKLRYQTVYARAEGSIAAPTAGLHFTEQVLERIEKKGVRIGNLTLHVGRGTFMPVRTDCVEEHMMEAEYFELSSELVDRIKRVKAEGGRVFTVGTTATRAVEGYLSGRSEACASGDGMIRGTTDIFIYPGYRFMAVDCLITNFHLPRSTPLLLAAAVAGRENILKAYAEGIAMGYRFFSYGDAMLISDR
jgi:S-adenosylmethionine:tRNA ribosyltransferase-isomerase